jgi:hypothetical protein
MTADTTKLVLIDDLDDASTTNRLAGSDVDALRAVAEHIKRFVAVPNSGLGRSGPVCPFVPGALDRRTLWLAAETVAGRRTPEIAELIKGYQKLFLDAHPAGADDAISRAFVVVFTDLPADRAGEFFGDLLADLAVPSYEADGFVMGGFYEGNEGTAIYNSDFQPFISPVPFLLMRQGVLSDWKFFLDDNDWLDRWALRFGTSGVGALAGELRGLPWREQHE